MSHSVSQSHNYAVVLGEEKGLRRLPIVIGGFEAQAIAVAMENMIPNRPLTHDLFKNTLNVFDVTIKEILINNLMDGIFYAKLICLKDNKEYSIDSRTSDAIAMAVRYHAPIYTYEFIMEAAGVILDDPDVETKQAKQEGKSKPQRKDLDQLGTKALENLLTKALEKEDYEKAAEIRDELKKREEGTGPD